MDLKFDDCGNIIVPNEYSLEYCIKALIQSLNTPSHRHIDLDEEKIKYISERNKEISARIIVAC